MLMGACRPHQEYAQGIWRPVASAEYASIQVPTYPSGQIGAFLARKAYADASKVSTCKTPGRDIPLTMDLRYYSAEMHTAAFALPAFIQRKLDSDEPASKVARLQ